MLKCGDMKTFNFMRANELWRGEVDEVRKPLYYSCGRIGMISTRT